MRIVLFCPSTKVINGGIKQIFAWAEALVALGYDAVVFEEQGRRPDWFASKVPVMGQGHLKPNADDIFILPEDQPQILSLFKNWPQRKILCAQNPFYGALSLKDVSSFADYGITHALCSSPSLLGHMEWRHPSIKSFLLPCAIDREVFRPAESKQQTILFMPRKRPVEAAFIKDIFTYSYPECAHWIWQEIEGKTEAQTAHMMGEGAVFLALSRLESFGLAPLEAMASGCIVAGFTGIGGRDYATPENGFWADEDDFPACAAQLRKAIDLASLSVGLAPRVAYQQAVETALAPYTPSAFRQSIAAAFLEIAPVDR